VNVILFGSAPEAKATTISASNVCLNLVIAVLSLLIGVISDAYGLRLGFGGVVLVMYVLGILVSLALLRRYPIDLARRDQVVAEHVAAGS
jgi:MFS-type transporter involved in bile tolerance (Atg22 family)